jgi:hypothetical protein
MSRTVLTDSIGQTCVKLRKAQMKVALANERKLKGRSEQICGAQGWSSNIVRFQCFCHLDTDYQHVQHYAFLWQRKIQEIFFIERAINIFGNVSIVLDL